MPPADDNIMLSPQRNVTFAVNYEVSIVDRFWQKTSAPRLNKKQDSSLVGPVQKSTEVNPMEASAGATAKSTQSSDDGVSSLQENAPSLPLDPSLQSPEAAKATLASLSDEDSSGSCKENKKKVVSFQSPGTQRRSSRETKKRQTPMERTRVRYDMEMVPAVRRNRVFLDKFPLWSVPATSREDKLKILLYKQQALIKDQQQKLLAAQNVQKQASQVHSQPIPLEEKKQPAILGDHKKQNEKVMNVPEQPKNIMAPKPQQEMEQVPLASTEAAIKALQDGDMSPELIDDDTVSPFAEDTSVIWVPKTRTEWEDSVLEMTAVCTSASLRRHMATRGRSSSSKPFHAPLSKEYIRDRVDIDDPLNGYQIRHKTGGWMQGFILWTNFTTWTHYFKWDSSHAMSGIPTMSSGSNSAIVDSDGSLAAELESQPRSGDPFEGGVVFEGVAEISLVGGLGCGEYLLRMALDSIRSKRAYKFVVLQATDSSKSFYERFGFVRVGAICRYERRDKEAAKPGARPGTPIMGYRHWTHPNESDTSLQKHGGPSYMMCLKLPEDDPNLPIPTPFLDAMMKLEVEHKPTIEQLGGSSTPYPKGKKPVDSAATNSPQDVGGTGARKKAGRSRRGSPSPQTTTVPTLPQLFSSSAQSPPTLPVLRGTGVPAPASATAQGKITRSGVKRTDGTSGDGNPITKRRRISSSTNLNTDKNSNQEMASDLGATPATSAAKPPPRRTPRTLTSATAALDAATGARNVSLPPTFNPPKASASINTKKKPPAKSQVKRSTPRRNPAPVSAPSSTASTTSPTPVTEKSSDPSRSGPMKQKVKSYPRDRVHFYNKVVRPKKGKKTENYFVLHYDEAKGTIRIIPMEPRGVLSGKRAGRPRFQAVMNNFDRDAKTVRCADYDIVKAFMVMKTPVVASEAWDVLDA